MPRQKLRDVQMERLQWENKALRDQIAKMRTEPDADSPLIGCMNSPCYVQSPKGLHTNGSCSCDERKLRQAILYLRRRCEFLQVTIQEMKEGRPEESYRMTAERFIRETGVTDP